MRLFIHNSNSTFVLQDRNILSANGPVNRFYYPPSTGLLTNAFHQLRLLLWLLYWLPRCQGVYVWFADYHSLLPAVLTRLTRKPLWVVLGGYDTMALPEYGYGSFTKPLRGFCSYWTMRFATVCLAVSEHTRNEAHKRCPQAHIEVIYNGAEVPSVNLTEERSNVIATVAIIDRPGRIPIKGIDRFVELARQLPGLHFLLIGVEEHCRQLLPILPPNLEVRPPMALKSLYRLLRQVKVYCQLSRSESFGLAAVEAAACGAIPVISSAGALPEVLGDYAEVWDGSRIEDCAQLVRNALARTPDADYLTAMRERFSLRQRRRALFDVLMRSR